MGLHLVHKQAHRHNYIFNHSCAGHTFQGLDAFFQKGTCAPKLKNFTADKERTVYNEDLSNNVELFILPSALNCITRINGLHSAVSCCGGIIKRDLLCLFPAL